MKKEIRLGIVLVCSLLLCACGNKKQILLPEEEQVKQICELSTLECEFNNVAIGEKSKGEGIAHLGEKDRKYWVEYTGVVKLGIDMSKVSMEIEENNVMISIPKAELQYIGIKEGSYNEESVITSKDAFFNKNKIMVEEQKVAITSAQESMKAAISENDDLMCKAQERAKSLIENYINSIGNATGITYNIEWKYLD